LIAPTILQAVACQRRRPMRRWPLLLELASHQPAGRSLSLVNRDPDLPRLSKRSRVRGQWRRAAGMGGVWTLAGPRPTAWIRWGRASRSACPSICGCRLPPFFCYRRTMAVADVRRHFFRSHPFDDALISCRGSQMYTNNKQCDVCFFVS